jgi:hypothetical protein
MEVLEEWLIIKLKDRNPIPKVKDINIYIGVVAAG